MFRQMWGSFFYGAFHCFNGLAALGTNGIK
jgi:hypothetical protein